MSNVEPQQTQRLDHSLATLNLHAGPLSAEMRVDASPVMMLAVGGLVSSILLSTAVLVSASVRSAACVEEAKRPN